MNINSNPTVDRRLIAIAEDRMRIHALTGPDLLKTLNSFEGFSQWRIGIDGWLCEAVDILGPVVLNSEDLQPFAPYQFEREFKTRFGESLSRLQERNALRSLLTDKIRRFAGIIDLNLEDDIQVATTDQTLPAW